MFGLRVPLAKSLPCASSDFDSVNTILSNSIYKADKSCWTSRADDRGNICHLEVDKNYTQLNSPRNITVCQCILQGCHGSSFGSHNGFATDDTGYGTDTEICLNGKDSTTTSNSGPYTKDHRKSKTTISHHVDSHSSHRQCENCRKIVNSSTVLDFHNMENLSVIILNIDTCAKNFSGLSSLDRSKKVGHVGRALCKSLLGIVPGHFRSGESVEKSSKIRQRICVRSLVRGGLAAKNPDISIGDCLRLVNDREVTWDNIDDVFLQLTKLKQVKLVLQQVSRPALVPVLMRTRLSTDEEQPQTLIENQCFPDTTEQDLNFSVMYINLEALNSESGPDDKDIMYQFPSVDHTLSKIRGCFITLYHVLGNLSQSQIKRSSFLFEGEIIHVGYHKEENGLLIFMYPAKKVHSSVLPCLVSDVVGVLRVQYGSVVEAFSDKRNIKELNMFFSLFHKNNGIQQSNIHTCLPVSPLCCSGCVQYLPLCNFVQNALDKVINKWEAADFAEMSDSFYGCRRTYTILGSCVFHKAWMLCNHLPKDDLHDLYLYLKCHSLLTLCESESVQQLVVWREVHPTRQWYDLGEEQMFGYTEPVSARWFWLIVGFKHTLLCTLLESAGCVSMTKMKPAPDPFYIDQAKAVLMQLLALDLPRHCDSRNPVHSLVCPVEGKRDIHTSPIRRSMEKLSSIMVKEDGVMNAVQKRQLSRSLVRKDSFNSEGSTGSNSSGGSNKRSSRWFPLEAGSEVDLNRNQISSNQHIKLTVGAENCLFHLIHIDKMEGVYIRPLHDMGTLQKDIIHNFHLSCTHIKHMFDRYRKKNSFSNENDNSKMPSDPDTSFYNLREEGVLFNVSNPEDESKCFAYWTIGRQRSKQELYVCFRDTTPQCMVELAFKMGFGLNS